MFYSKISDRFDFFPVFWNMSPQVLKQYQDSLWYTTSTYIHVESFLRNMSCLLAHVWVAWVFIGLNIRWAKPPGIPNIFWVSKLRSGPWYFTKRHHKEGNVEKCPHQSWGKISGLDVLASVVFVFLCLLGTKCWNHFKLIVETIQSKTSERQDSVILTLPGVLHHTRQAKQLLWLKSKAWDWQP